jgi:hypothetical protein
MISSKELKKCSRHKIGSEYLSNWIGLNELISKLWAQGIPVKVKDRPAMGKLTGTKYVYVSVPKKYKKSVRDAFKEAGIKVRIGPRLY